MKKPDIPLARSLGLASTTALGLGAMIGAGIFVLTGMGAGVAGPALILAFALNGLIAFVTVLSFAEMSSAFPDSGGTYTFANKVIFARYENEHIRVGNKA